ncbi:MAG TPA: NrfD/PsrC family molybdoenzyme membrane anchor subunit, partial [Dehalococcoidia bacterium]|nr:NrfD/PsrC family molybdoenzyme membrane anchor subunit [Dehalococcoidia bacterium]
MRVEISQRNLAIPLGIVWLAALAVGLVGVSQRLLSGHELANYTSSIPWGLWVAAYVYFVGLSAGSFLLSALIYVFGLKRLEPIGKLALFTALVALIAALL